MLEHVALGLSIALSLENVFFCFLGVTLGTLVGVLPGVGPTATIGMLLPLTLVLSPTTALIMIAGIYYGAQYGGSTTAILVNVPGEATSAVTAIDGYQMSLKGQAGPALMIAAVGSFVGGCFANFLVLMFAEPLTSLALLFQAPDYFALMLLALVSCVALASGSVLNALAMIVLGLCLSTIGVDSNSSAMRFTFGHLEVAEGFNIVAVAVGLFGFSEILRNLESSAAGKTVVSDIGKLMPSREDLRRSAGAIMRGTCIGSALGVLPGGGLLLAVFASYAAEKRFSRNPERFGQGAIEGVAGPEAANNAAAQVSFIPMLTLGIPANSVMALMIGAMIIHGIVPGPNVINVRPDLFWGLIVSMWLGNAMLLVLNLPLVGLWVRLLKVPTKILFPSIIVFSAIGVFTVNYNYFDLLTLAAFGLIGYAMYKIDCEPVPLLLGFILGPLIEEYFRRSLVLGRGNFEIFVSRPISLAILSVCVLALLVVTLPAVKRKRTVVFNEDD